MKLIGKITLDVDGEIVSVDGNEFEDVEGGNRSLGVGQYQQESLFVYDEDNRFEVRISATDDGNMPQIHSINASDESADTVKVLDDETDIMVVRETTAEEA